MVQVALRKGGLLLAAQLATAFVAILALGFVPPASGTMLLVPLRGDAVAQLVPLALAAGATVVAPGALSGSLIVHGERARLLAPMLAAGIVPVGARPPCGVPR